MSLIQCAYYLQKDEYRQYRQCKRFAIKTLNLDGLIFHFCRQHYKIVKKEEKEK